MPALLVRDEGDNDDKVVGDDDDEGEISTSVDSSSSSAPASGEIVDVAAVVVAVAVALVAFAGSILIFFSRVVYSGPISTFHSRFAHSLCLAEDRLRSWRARSDLLPRCVYFSVCILPVCFLYPFSIMLD